MMTKRRKSSISEYREKVKDKRARGVGLMWINQFRY